LKKIKRCIAAKISSKSMMMRRVAALERLAMATH
jgi:hypothetical protein